MECHLAFLYIGSMHTQFLRLQTYNYIGLSLCNMVVCVHPNFIVDQQNIHRIEARVVVRWLADALSEYVAEMPADQELQLMKTCVILGFNRLILCALSMTIPEKHMCANRRIHLGSC